MLWEWNKYAKEAMEIIPSCERHHPSTKRGSSLEVKHDSSPQALYEPPSDSENLKAKRPRSHDIHMGSLNLDPSARHHARAVCLPCR